MDSTELNEKLTSEILRNKQIGKENEILREAAKILIKRKVNAQTNTFHDDIRMQANIGKYRIHLEARFYEA